MSGRNVFFTAGITAALIAAFAGCVNPLSSTTAFREAPSDSSQTAPDETSVGVQPEEFTVTLRTGAAGASRTVAGPSAGTIRYGSIRNTAQVIVVDNDGAVVDFEQVRRLGDNDSAASIEVKNIDTGSAYHFLVLMGHQERDYGAEELSFDDDYVYIPGQAPTLLAAGFATATISGAAGETITVTMNPVVVDTVFEYGTTIIDAALAGVTLPLGVSGASLTWKVTGGFSPLINAQQKILSYKDENTLLFRTGKTIIRKPGGGEEEPSVTSPLGGIDSNEITQVIGTTDAGYGSANFNLEYAPFNLTDSAAWNEVSLSGAFDGVFVDSVPVWIIRNGINDTAQNNRTEFLIPAETSPCRWNGTEETKYNGNGAVRFNVAGLDQDLTRYIPAPVRGGTPKPDFFGTQYMGTVAWSGELDGNNTFKVGQTYTAVVTLAPNPGWTFEGVGADSFTHSGADPLVIPPNPSNAAGSGTVTITFPATPEDVPVGDLDLTDKIPRPAAGVTPGTDVFGTQYTGTADWSVTGGAALSAAFQASTLYTAKLTLNAAPGYTFKDIAGAFTYGGGTVTHGPGIGAEIIVTIDFPVTDGPAAIPGVTDFGGIDTADSALYHMNRRKDGGPLAITLTPNSDPDTEDLDEVVLITRGAGEENTPRTVTINGGGRTLCAAAGSGTPLITLKGDGYAGGLVVTLTNITIQGTSGLNAPLVKLVDKARLVLGKEAIIKDNTESAANGGGVSIGPGSVLEMMNGSVIKDNTLFTASGAYYGGGVYNDGGTFTMNYGSKLTGNEALSGAGGGVYTKVGTVTIAAGTEISGNKAKTSGGAVFAAGSSTSSMVVDISGGSITSNTAGNGYGGGVYLSGGILVMSSGFISKNESGNSAGGVYVSNGVFKMSGGIISENTAKDSKGGGVYVTNTAFEMMEGKIKANTAWTHGGGVYVENGTFEMRDSEIFYNEVLGAGSSSNLFGGGGVALNNSSEKLGTFTMKNGAKIYGNKAEKAGARGGGVLVYSSKKSGGEMGEGGTFTMQNNSEIYENRCRGGGSDIGGGAGVTFEKGKFSMETGSIIRDNTVTSNDNYLAGGLYIGSAVTEAVNVAGVISGNKVVKGPSTGLVTESGGGVFNASTGTFTLLSGGSISYNEVTGTIIGGGVFNHRSGKFVMETGSSIDYNKVFSGGGSYNGGGVYNFYNESNSSFEMEMAGSISYNEANYNETTGDYVGGGVLQNGGKFTGKTGGRITNNKAGGGGIHISGGIQAGPWSGGVTPNGITITGNTPAP